MPTDFNEIGNALGKIIEHTEVKDLLTGLSDADSDAVMEWIKKNICCRTADDTDYKLEWK